MKDMIYRRKSVRNYTGKPVEEAALEKIRVNVKSVDNLAFIILIAFGYPKGPALRSDVKEFKRKSLAQIADREDTRLEPARLAPSSVNSQPWYFAHEGEQIHAYCAPKGLLKVTGMGYMNRIDMGIALAHMYVAYPETFCFSKLDGKGKGYIGSFVI